MMLYLKMLRIKYHNKDVKTFNENNDDVLKSFIAIIIRYHEIPQKSPFYNCVSFVVMILNPTYKMIMKHVKYCKTITTWMKILFFLFIRLLKDITIILLLMGWLGGCVLLHELANCLVGKIESSLERFQKVCWTDQEWSSPHIDLFSYAWIQEEIWNEKRSFSFEFI